MSYTTLHLQTRKAHNVELQGNVVIFDEAHNLVRKRPMFKFYLPYERKLKLLFTRMHLGYLPHIIITPHISICSCAICSISKEVLAAFAREAGHSNIRFCSERDPKEQIERLDNFVQNEH